MNTPILSTPTLLAALALGLALPLGAVGQQQPLTSHMMGGQPEPTAAHAATPARVPLTTSAPSDITPAPSPAPMPLQAPAGTSVAGYYGSDIGAVTRHLLQTQVDGRQAGQRLPTLGAEASASYRRYLDSFNHPIPEFYEATVGKNSTDGR